MSEIEKMYIRCKIKKQQTCSHSDTCYNGSLNECEGCNAYQYPPFTAEKQLELIKWLMCRQQTTQIELRYYENDFCISRVTDCPDNENVEYVTFGRHSIFDEAIADLINSLWQDLTKEEKAEIKRILE